MVQWFIQAVNLVSIICGWIVLAILVLDAIDIYI